MSSLVLIRDGNAQTASRLSIAMIGGFGVTVDGRPLAIQNRKCCALLGHLALLDGRSIARERMVGLLWSEVEDEKARQSLRQAIYELNGLLVAAGFDGLKADKLSLTLERGRFTVDVLEAIECAAAGRVHPSLEVECESLEGLLQPLESVDQAFSAWVRAKRRQLLEQLTVALEGALSRPSAGDETDAVARALLRLDATNEIGVRHLMESRFRQGDIGGALGAYRALWDLLSDEFDSEPTAPTQELAARIKLAEPSTEVRLPPPPVAATRAARLLISVDAFDMTGADPQHHYRILGFRRDLLSCLVRFREWLVRDGATPAPQAFGPVDEYVIETSAYDAPGGMFLALTLREAATGIYLWSERLAMEPERWFEIQQTVVRRLAAVLNLHISSGRLNAAVSRPDGALRAYDLWLLGQSEMREWTAEGTGSAMQRLETITRQHPDFAPAYSGLAQVLNSLHFAQPGQMRTAAVTAAALRNAQEATRLDPVDARGHLSLGWANAMAGRHDRAAVHHELAVELNDTDSWTLLSAALGAASRAEHERAAELNARSAELCIAPMASHWGYRAQIAFLAGDYESCVETAAAAARGIPSSPGWRIAALGQLGRRDQGRAEMAEFAAFIGERWAGEGIATEEAVATWFLQLFPFAREQDWAVLRDSFARLGLDVGRARFVEPFA